MYKLILLIATGILY